ncbi:predicted protein [Nematostella vectensis]|uniref:Uncharacterized protein n=1 Tax=Nematostella vectensis TaxID=45351 RepID=A7RKJ9_NEMVE|nr:predicted protein [Nematostella vectensis]|eukprot:XP_001639982.1 predicted protein [Nematostella vectensis]
MEKNRNALLELAKRPGNNTCADCGAKHPEWASASKGIFICITCSGVHRNLGTQISVVKSLRLDTWTDERLQFMIENGNEKSNAIWAKNVPICYRRPKCTDPHVLREQWIRAKYERKEFIDGAPEPCYLSGSKTGILKKKKKDENQWKDKLFVLNQDENSLCYFLQATDPHPKDVLKITEVNVVFAEEKSDKPNSLQFTWVKEGKTRNYFVCSDSGKDIVDWYMAIRAAKLNLLGLNKPGVKHEDVSHLLSKDFLMEGYLHKTGPKSNDGWLKRWFTLDGRRLLYFDKPMDAFGKGEVYIGSKEEGFSITEGITTEHKPIGQCLTLKTPNRVYNLSADTENERQMWVDAIQSIVSMPMTDQEKKGKDQ